MPVVQYPNGSKSWNKVTTVGGRPFEAGYPATDGGEPMLKDRLRPEGTGTQDPKECVDSP